MKTILLISTVFLCLGTVVSYAQEQDPKSHGAEASIGLIRGINKIHDLQASPMQYFTNYNGLKGDYSRINPNDLWHFGFEAGFGDMIAPSLGKRQLRFDEGGESFYLVPTLYQGSLFVQYQRKISNQSKNKNYLGVKIRDKFFYADGLAMNIWTMNLLELSANYTIIRQFGQRHQLEGSLSFPLFASISRMPFSNVVSQPDMSQAKAFLEGAEWEILGNYLHPELGITYQFAISKRNSLRFSYRYHWLSYAQPRSIRMSDHQIGLAYVYKFQFSK